MPPVTTRKQSAESLNRIADDLDGISDALRIAAGTLKAVNVQEVEVSNYSSLLKGFDRLESFVSAVRKAVKVVRGDRGDYTAAGDTSVSSGDTANGQQRTYGDAVDEKEDTKRRKNST